MLADGCGILTAPICDILSVYVFSALGGDIGILSFSPTVYLGWFAQVYWGFTYVSPVSACPENCAHMVVYVACETGF